MSTSKQSILQKYGLSAGDLIQKGMEAEVYALGDNALLKLYINTTNLAHLRTLQEFYAAIDSSALSYSLPFICSVSEQDGICISVERRLPGIPMSAILPSLSKTQMDFMMHTYLAAALELGRVRIPPGFDRYRLFDIDSMSHRGDGDWHGFLNRYLAYKLTQVRIYLEGDVLDFSAKMERLSAILSQPYTRDYRLVHGDFF